MDEYKYGETLCYELYRWSPTYGKTYKYRCGSVPGIHKYGHGSCYRYPKTQQELTYIYVPDEDDRELLTSSQISHLKGSNRDLPTAWDDIPKSSCWDRKSWKNYRKNQYK